MEQVSFIFTKVLVLLNTAVSPVHLLKHPKIGDRIPRDANEYPVTLNLFPEEPVLEACKPFVNVTNNQFFSPGYPAETYTNNTHCTVVLQDIECSKRWSYIRDYYIRKRGKPGTGSAGEAAKKRMEQLIFLDSCLSGKRSTITNIPGDVAEKNCICGTYSKLVSNITEEEEGFQIYDEIQTSLGSPEPVSTTPCDLNNIPSGPSPKRKYLSSKSKNSDERMKLLQQIAGKKRELEQDVNELFFASMAKIVKKLPEVQQSKMRMYIGNYVGNAEIDFLSGHTSQALSCLSSGLSCATSSNSCDETLGDIPPTTTASQATQVTPTNDEYPLINLV